MKYMGLNNRAWPFMEEPLSHMISHGDNLDKIQADIKTHITNPKTYFKYGINAFTIYDVSGEHPRIVYCYVVMGDTRGHMEIMCEGWSYIDACSKLPNEYHMYQPKDYSGMI